MMAKMKKSKKGFTLVELIVVIAIIAIIAAVAVPTTISFVKKAQIGTASSEAISLTDSINTYISSQLTGTVTLDSDKLKAMLDELMPEVKDVKTVVFGTQADGKITVTVVTGLAATADEAEKEGAEAFSAAGAASADGDSFVGAQKNVTVPGNVTVAAGTFTYSEGAWTAQA